MAHGDSGGASNRELLATARTLRARGLFAGVLAGAINGWPTAANLAARRRTAEAYVVPLLMCDGRTTRTTLPALFGDAGTREAAGLRVCPPLGLHPGLPDLLRRRAEAACYGLEARPEEATLLLVAHGSSRSGESAAATEAVARCLAGRFGAVRTAFLEQSPRLEAVLAATPGPLVVAGLFAGSGPHAARDVPAALAAERCPGAGPLTYLGAIGADPAVPELILEMVRAADRRAELLATSFETPAVAGSSG